MTVRFSKSNMLAPKRLGPRAALSGSAIEVFSQRWHSPNCSLFSSVPSWQQQYAEAASQRFAYY